MHPITPTTTGFSFYHTSVAVFLMAATLFFLSACAPLGNTPPSGDPKEDSNGKPSISLPQGPSASLYQEARSLMQSHQYQQAEIRLERALRIEPQNGYYWHTMAQLKYLQNQNGQARQFCLKSNSLAGKDWKLRDLNRQLLLQLQAPQ